MNCVQFRKYVGAFADGELGTERNLDALEHLNMCPACVRRVDGIHALKRVLARRGAGERAPERLRARIVDALRDAECPSARRSWWRPSARRSWWRPPRAALIPSAIAAAILLTVGIVRPWSDAGRTTTGVTLLKALAVDTRAQHHDCEVMGAAHHNPALPRDLSAITTILSGQLHLRVAANDLSGFGLEFLGADLCGIRGRPGAHILYQSHQTGAFVSVFTVTRIPGLDMNHRSPRTGQSYFAATDDSPGVIAWSTGGQSYVVCGRESADDLLKVADFIRSATP